MDIDTKHWRPITFQGVTLPPAMMAISVLESIVEIQDEEASRWLWHFPICCGVTKTAPADQCVRFAQKAVDVMLEHRPIILEGIGDRLGEAGFDPETTYGDWLQGLRCIIELGRASGGECVWTAPEHIDDQIQSEADAQRLLDQMFSNEKKRGD